MTVLKNFISWYWNHAVYFGIVAILISLGLFFSGIWMTVLTLSTIPMYVSAWFCLVLLIFMMLCMTGSLILNVGKMVKSYRDRQARLQNTRS